MNWKLCVHHQAFNRHLQRHPDAAGARHKKSLEPWIWKIKQKWGETCFKVIWVLYWSKRFKQKLFEHKASLSLLHKFPGPHLVLKCCAYGLAPAMRAAVGGSGNCLLRRLKHGELIFARFKVMLLENSAELICTLWLGVTPWLSVSLWAMEVHCRFGLSGLRNKAQNSYQVVILLLWQGPCLKSEPSKRAERTVQIFSPTVTAPCISNILTLNNCTSIHMTAISNWLSLCTQCICSSSAATKKLL